MPRRLGGPLARLLPLALLVACGARPAAPTAVVTPVGAPSLVVGTPVVLGTVLSFGPPFTLDRPHPTPPGCEAACAPPLETFHYSVPLLLRVERTLQGHVPLGADRAIQVWQAGGTRDNKAGAVVPSAAAPLAPGDAALLALTLQPCPDAPADALSRCYWAVPRLVYRVRGELAFPVAPDGAELAGAAAPLGRFAAGQPLPTAALPPSPTAVPPPPTPTPRVSVRAGDRVNLVARYRLAQARAIAVSRGAGTATWITEEGRVRAVVAALDHPAAVLLFAPARGPAPGDVMVTFSFGTAMAPALVYRPREGALCSLEDPYYEFSVAAPPELARILGPD